MNQVCCWEGRRAEGHASERETKGERLPVWCRPGGKGSVAAQLTSFCVDRKPVTDALRWTPVKWTLFCSGT